jgi:hypothetical protein
MFFNPISRIAQAAEVKEEKKRRVFDFRKLYLRRLFVFAVNAPVLKRWRGGLA